MKKSTISTIVGFASLTAFFLFSGLECSESESVDPDSQHCLLFRSYKLVWAQEQVGSLDQPINAEYHFEKQSDNDYSYIYGLHDPMENVCEREAITIDV